MMGRGEFLPSGDNISLASGQYHQESHRGVEDYGSLSHQRETPRKEAYVGALPDV